MKLNQKILGIGRSFVTGSYLSMLMLTMKKLDAPTVRIILTAGTTYIGRFSSTIAVLVNLPMARQSLSPELFGVWMLLSALLGFMSFADLGVGNGVLNNTTKVNAKRDTKFLHRTLISGYAVTSGAGLLLYLSWLLWSCLSHESTSLVGHISMVNRVEVMRALTIFVFFLAINIPFSLVQKVQLGLQKGYWNGVNQLVSALLMILAVPLTLSYGGGLSELILATLGVQTLVNVTNTLIWLYFNNMFRMEVWFSSLDKLTTIGLLRTGSMFFVLQLAAAFAFQSDAIVISHTLGTSVYGDFAIVQKLFLFISMILSAAMIGLWPAFGDAFTNNKIDWVIKALKRAMLGAAVISILLVTILSVIAPSIIEFWLKADLRPGWDLLLVLAIWTVIDAVAQVPAAFMNGAGILRAQLLVAIAMASTAFAAKWLLTPIMGVAGAVLSTILAYCLISIPCQIYIFKKTFKTKGEHCE